MSILKGLAIDSSAQERLSAWLRENAEDLHNPRITDLRVNSGGGGFSNETLLANLTDGSVEKRIVIRLAASDPEFALFPKTDIEKQFRVMNALNSNANVPVPNCRYFDREGTIFGEASFIMDFVDGSIPSDEPPHTHEGFIFDATEAERAHLWWSSLEAIAQVGRVDVDASGLGFLKTKDQFYPLSSHLEFYEKLYRWGRAASPDLPDVERAIDWLKSEMPRENGNSLIWGDSRFANFIYRDFEPVALLDWELAGVGDPECDLAYFLVMQHMTEVHPVPGHSRPRLPGFPSDEESIDAFGEMLGRPVKNFRYYWIFNAFKTFSMTQRFYDLIHKAGWVTFEEAEAGKDQVGPLRGFLQSI